MGNDFIFSEENISNAVTAWENDALRETYQNEFCELFKRAISNNNKFSRDFILDKALKQVFNIVFYPTSDSYCKYGQYLTIVGVSEEEKKYLQLGNVKNQNCLDTIKLVAFMENSGENVDVIIRIKDIYELESR